MNTDDQNSSSDIGFDDGDTNIEPVTPTTGSSELLENLKLEAESLGIKVTAASTEKSLTEKIKLAKAESLKLNTEQLEEALLDKTDSENPVKKVKGISEAARKKQMAMKLHRVRITCNDRKISDRGHFFKNVGNSVVNVAKVIPLDVPTHVPAILLKRIRKEKFISFKKVKRNGIQVAEPRELPTFVVEELPPLTIDELKRIAIRQQATSQIED